MADGFEPLQQKLRALSGDFERKAHRKALGKVGKIVQAAMQDLAPVKDTTHGILAPEELKQSFKARVSVPDDAGTVAGKTARVVIGPVGKTVKLIAADVEYGHGNPTAKKGSKRTPANPFIRPAKDMTSVEAETAYRHSLIEDVKEALKTNG